MDETIFASVYLGDARLATHATSANAVWLWSADGSRILWANPAARAALSGKASPGKASPDTALLERVFPIGDPARAHIERIAGALPPGGGARLFRLRGFAGAAWGSLTCSCARFDFGRTTGILVVASEPVGAEIPLAEQVRRLGLPANDAVAAYSPEGTLLFATTAAEPRLAGAKTLAALDIAVLATDALAGGEARGASAVGPVVLQRVGRGPSTVLLVAFPHPAPAVVAAAAPASPASAEFVARRRHPLRFVWQMDAAGRFFIDSEEFADLVDAGAREISGRPWPEINAELGLDPQELIAAAVASRETWSNIAVSWPTSTGERLEVELAGLPTFDRNRSFRGYRGFGVCRDVLQIETLTAAQPGLARMPAAPAAVSPPRPSDVVASEPASPDEPEPLAERPDAGPSPVAPNVVRFPGVSPLAELRTADGGLGSGDHSAFHELARQLSVRLQAADAAPERPLPAVPANLSVTASSGRLAPAVLAPARGSAAASDDARPVLAADDRVLLNRLPVGILVYRYEEILFANRTFLGWTGYPDLSSLQMDGDVDALFPDDGITALMEAGEGGDRVLLATRDGDPVPAEGRLFPVFWEGSSAFAALVFKTAALDQIRSLEAAQARAETIARELGRLLDRVEDTALVIDAAGTIVSAHGGGQALFGRRALEGMAFEGLFEPQSRPAAAAHVAGVRHEGGPVSAEHVLLGADGQLRPMTVTIAPAAAAPERLTVILREAPAANRAEPKTAGSEDSAALDAAAALGRLCQDARSPINAIVGFCDLILEETFGPVGNSRYREYIRDIKSSGAEVMLRLVEAAELAEIMAGTSRLSPVRISLNEIVNLCVAERQESASEARVVIRTALSPGVQPILADAAAVRSMIDNLLGHALQTTPPGGQVIVSTGRSPDGDAMLRIRDSGEGLNEKAIAAAMQTPPPRTTDRWDASTWDPTARAAGLALVKALAEANHAHFTITSKPNQGSLFEVVFTAKPKRLSNEPAAPAGPSPERATPEISSPGRAPRPADGTR